MALFVTTSRFAAAVARINAIDVALFSKLIGRIVPKLHETHDDRIFSEAEEAQLQQMLEMDAEQLATVLQACCYVFERAGYMCASPAKLVQGLTDCGLTEAHAHAFGRAWAAARDGILEKLRERPFGAPHVLRDSHWQLQVRMGQKDISKLKETAAVAQFVTSTSDDTSSTDAVAVEFSHAELFEFFDKLEKVQEQLDALGYS